MPRLMIILGLLTTAACVVDPPKPETGTYLCEQDADCAKDYVCLSRDSSSPSVCVRDLVCGPTDCGAGFECTGDPPRCWPTDVSGPCQTKPCTDELVCVPDSANQDGYRCEPCTNAGCPSDQVCVQVFSATPGCRPRCGEVGGMCDVLGKPGKCGEVTGYPDAPANATVAPVKACVRCPDTCTTDATCRLRPYPADGTELPWAEAAFCHCVEDDQCSTGERCVLQDAASNVCVVSCATPDAPCPLDTTNGFCTSIRNPNGNTPLVCLPCDADCGPSGQCEVTTYGNDMLTQTARQCECTEATCTAEGDGYRCIPAEPLAGARCSNACGDPLPGCPPDGTICNLGICVLPFCGDGIANLAEACDDHDDPMGPCRQDCSGPECNWGLLFGGPAGSVPPNGVAFYVASEHDLVAPMTIAFWLRVPSGVTGPQTILRKQSFVETPGYRIVWNNGHLELVMRDPSGAQETVISGNLSPNTLHYAAVVLTSTTVQWYVDRVASGNSGGLLAGSLVNDESLTLGATGSEPLAVFELDELRIWKDARPETGVPNVRQCSEIDGDSDLVGEWLFDYVDFGKNIFPLDTSAVQTPYGGHLGSVAGGMVP